MYRTDITTYDGSLIHQRFAYRFFRDQVYPLGNIVAFRGSMEVKENLVDLEDALNNDFIHSEDAIQFVWELPNIDRFAGVCFQRLFNTNVANILHRHTGLPIEVNGDDIKVNKEFTGAGGIIVPKGKASVSICHEVNGANLGHLGINIKAGSKAPVFAYSTEMDDETIKLFARDVITSFYEMLDDIFIATSKTAIL